MFKFLINTALDVARQNSDSLLKEMKESKDVLTYWIVIKGTEKYLSIISSL